MPYHTKEYIADTVTLGNFILPQSMVNKIKHKTTPLNYDYKRPPQLENRALNLKDGFYIGADKHRPKIGDLRIQFSVVLPVDLSIITRMQDQTSPPYPLADNSIEYLYIDSNVPGAVANTTIGGETLLYRFILWLLFYFAVIGTFEEVLIGVSGRIPVWNDIYYEYENFGVTWYHLSLIIGGDCCPDHRINRRGFLLAFLFSSVCQRAVCRCSSL